MIVRDDDRDRIGKRARIAARSAARHVADSRPVRTAFRVGSGALSIVPQRGDST
jgi:hypothetical protein